MPRPQRNRRDKKKGPQLSFRDFEVTQPTKLDDEWEVKAIATVLYGNRAPEPPREIVFAVDGSEYERVMTDSETGIATSVMFFRETGNHIITAFVSDFLSLMRKHRFYIKEEKKKTPEEKELEVIEARKKRVQAEKELKEAEKEPSQDEQATVDFKAKTARVKAEKEYREAVPPEGRRSIKILHRYQRISRLEVVFQRIGKDGKPEEGAISVLDFEQGGIAFGETTSDSPSQVENWRLVTVFLPYFEYARRVTFFLPDDPDADKVTVDVPARPRSVERSEGRSARISETNSASQRISEAWQRGRQGEWLEAKNPGNILPLAAVAGSVLAAILAFKGPEGPGGK